MLLWHSPPELPARTGVAPPPERASHAELPPPRGVAPPPSPRKGVSPPRDDQGEGLGAALPPRRWEHTHQTSVADTPGVTHPSAQLNAAQHGLAGLSELLHLVAHAKGNLTIGMGGSNVMRVDSAAVRCVPWPASVPTRPRRLHVAA